MIFTLSANSKPSSWPTSTKRLTGLMKSTAPALIHLMTGLSPQVRLSPKKE